MRASTIIQGQLGKPLVITAPQTRESTMNAAPVTQNEAADIGFFRNIGLAFIVLTAIAGSMTVGLIVQQSNAAPTTIASAE
jgi:hypothetical protein